MLKSYFILKLLCLCHAESLVTSTIVETTTGLVRGKLNHYEDSSYFSYEGIPYAEPPLCDLRFKPPVPIKPWTHILDAIAPGPVCPQIEYFFPRSEMSENCLFLNIYVPVTSSVTPLPVVFAVHGGYYTVDAGRPRPIYGPQMLLQRGLIWVTINYRLGALGFLSFNNIEASGNAGLKDILLASKWVKNNIAQFGGNPNQICLYGMGAGSALSHYLLLTNQTSGIFQTAIMISGSATSYRSLQVDPKKNALKLARQLGIKYKDNRIIRELKEIDAFEIIEAEDYIINNDPRKGFAFINFFAPAIERPSSIALITRDPLDIVRTEGLVQKIPIAAGFNNQEGLEIFVAVKNDPTIVNKLNENFELCIPSNIKYPYNSQARKDLARSIREFYFPGGNISIVNTQNYINLITDTAYAYAMDSWIKLYKSREFTSPIYYYILGVDSELNWAKQLENITYPGACRGDELGYIFVTNITENKLKNLDEKTKYIANSMLTLVKDFVTFRNPTPQTQGGFQWVETSVNRNHVTFVDVSVTNVNEPPLQERLGFWYREYAKYYEYERRNRGNV